MFNRDEAVAAKNSRFALLEAKHAEKLTKILGEVGIPPQELTKYAPGTGLAILQLRGAELLTSYNLCMLRDVTHSGNAAYSEDITWVIFQLQEMWILTQANFTALIQNAKYVQYITGMITWLLQTNLLNKASLDALFRNIQSIELIVKIASGLYNKSLLSQESLAKLIQNIWGTPEFAWALSYLNQADILTTENFITLNQNAQVAYGISWALFKLLQANILNQANFDTLLTNIQYIGHIPKLLSELQILGFLNQASFNELIQNFQYVSRILQSLSYLNWADLVTIENFTVLAQNVYYAPAINWALSYLAQIGLLTKENFTAFIQNIPYVKNIELAILADIESTISLYAINTLQQAHFNILLPSLCKAALLTPENWSKLTTNVQHLDGIAQALTEPEKAGLLNQTNFDMVLAKADYALNFVLFVRNNKISLSENNLCQLYNCGAKPVHSLASKCLTFFWQGKAPLVHAPNRSKELLDILPKEAFAATPPLEEESAFVIEEAKDLTWVDTDMLALNEVSSLHGHYSIPSLPY